MKMLSIDNDDGNHDTTIFIATFSASRKYGFSTHKKMPIEKKKLKVFDYPKVYRVTLPFLSINFIELETKTTVFF